MYLTIADGPEGVRYALVEPEDCTRLHVSAPGVPHHVVGELLARAKFGKAAPPPNVWLDVARLKALATAQDPQRARQFDDMIAYAGTKGWLDDTGTCVRAHVVPDED